MKRFLLVYVAPTYLLLATVVAPLALGSETLFLRDTFAVHLGMKADLAQAMRAHELPLVFSHLGGGQPSVGNPNSVPLYPDNLLYLVTPLLWAFNAHFWLHLLLAPWAMFWFARAWGLGRPAAWAAGVSYTFSGFFLSHMSFYNLVAGATLAPALAAALLGLIQHQRRRDLVATAGLWALLLLGGEPLIAGQALLLALSAAAVKAGRAARAPRRWLAVGGSLLAGTLVAAPQLVELLRILSTSARGHRGFSLDVRLAASFHPAQVLEWFLPTGFGRGDQLLDGAFWGFPFYGGEPLFFFSLAPGALALILVLLSGGPKDRLRIWAWLTLAMALFLALGRYNPAARFLLGLPGAELLRYPIKFWLAVAVPASLLAGAGFQRIFEDWQGPPRRWFRIFLCTMALGYGLFAAGFWLFPGLGEALLRELIPEALPASLVVSERLRWLGLAATGFLISAGSAALSFLRHRSLAAPALLALHGAGQLFLLAPLLATDTPEIYQAKLPLLDSIPAEAEVVHGAAQGLFGGNLIREGVYPESSALWAQRRTAYELYPSHGAVAGRRYELHLSPEGLSAFLTRAARDAVKQLDDSRRIRLLAAWGVDRLILQRPLDPHALPQVRLLDRRPSFGHQIQVFEISGAAPDVLFARRRVYAPNLNAALELLYSRDFDATRTVILPGEGPPEEGAGGTVQVLREDRESLEVEVEAQGPGAVLWQRAHLPLYRATIDGRDVAVNIGNLHRIAVQVPTGRHRVRIWVDRRPFHRAWALSLLGFLLMALWIRPKAAKMSRS